MYYVNTKEYIMRKYIFASHGQLANGIVDSLKMIIGNSELNYEVFCLKIGESPDYFSNIVEEEIVDNNEVEFVIMVDLYGASVCQSFYRLCKYDNVYIFTGMNLGLALSLVLTSSINKDEIENIISASKDGIKYLEYIEVEEEDF